MLVHGVFSNFCASVTATDKERNILLQNCTTHASVDTCKCGNLQHENKLMCDLIWAQCLEEYFLPPTQIPQMKTTFAQVPSKILRFAIPDI